MWQVVQQVFAQAWQQFAAQSLALLPNVLASLLFLAIGTALAVLAGRVAKFLLRRSAVERRANQARLVVVARARGDPERHGRRRQAGAGGLRHR